MRKIEFRNSTAIIESMEFTPASVRVEFSLPTYYTVFR